MTYNEDARGKEPREERDMKANEIISESEKAIQVTLGSGNVVGSVKGWKLWIPKSQIA